MYFYYLENQFKCSFKSTNTGLDEVLLFDKTIERTGELMGKQDVSEKMREVYEKNQWSGSMPFDEYVIKRTKLFQLRATFQKMAEASESSHRCFVYCIDASLNIWIQKGKAYCIPYGESWLIDAFPIDSVPGVEEYGYWNNSDRPEEISQKSWDAREKNWDNICDNWDEARMTHIVIEAKSKVGLLKIAEHFLPQDLVYASLQWK